jgi:hypothetical protein
MVSVHFSFLFVKTDNFHISIDDSTIEKGPGMQPKKETVGTIVLHVVREVEIMYASLPALSPSPRGHSSNTLRGFEDPPRRLLREALPTIC